MKSPQEEVFLEAVRKTIVLASYMTKKPLSQILELSVDELLDAVLQLDQRSEDPSQPH